MKGAARAGAAVVSGVQLGEFTQRSIEDIDYVNFYNDILKPFSGNPA